MRYFAYGANIDPIHMEDRCPTALPLGPATLPDHRFRIGRAGYATVEPEQDAVVLGFLWDISELDEAALDEFEGVAEQLYDKHVVEVTLPSGDATPALIYRAIDSFPGTARPRYLERVIAVAAFLDFPEPYLDELRRYLPAR